jgi:glycosyltransferase involved in cell wall biosynthesis
VRVCVVGKYPPIEGGVSTTTYWLVRGLAELGHEVHVVTNADDVEDTYRMALDDGDASWYQPEFPAPGSRVQVRSVQRFSPVAMRHIPVANPFVSRLASAVTNVVRGADCDVILAYYLEPYAVAGWMASVWTDRPLVIRHAGSDLDRLFRVPDLATTYKEILRRAEAVITRPELMDRFRGLGVPRERLYESPWYGVPREVFRPDAAPLDIGSAAIAPGWRTPPPEPDSFRPWFPTIGVYGKVGGPKGTFDLIVALGILAREGLAFNVAAMTGAGQARRLEEGLREAGILDRTSILPLLPNWKVPSFLRACTAVCFLERDFPVAIHGPIVPREILACGTCLVLSGEIAAKQRGMDLVHGENVLLVDDPRNPESLSSALRRVVTRPEVASAIAERGSSLADADEDHSSYVTSWEKILTAVASRSSTHEHGAAPRTGSAPSAYLELLPLGLVAQLRRLDPQLVPEQPADGSPTGDFATAVGVCERAMARLDWTDPDDRRDVLVEALRYQRDRLRARHDPAGEDAAPFPATDRLGGLSVTGQSVRSLRPVRSSRLTIETYRHYVVELLARWSREQEESLEDQDEAVDAVRRRPLTVLFLRSVNLSPCELLINEETRRLVELCDGTRTTAEVVRDLHRQLGSDPDAEASTLAAVLPTLARLYELGAIVFAEFRPGWGWTGGPRT